MAQNNLNIILVVAVLSCCIQCTIAKASYRDYYSENVHLMQADEYDYDSDDMSAPNEATNSSGPHKVHTSPDVTILAGSNATLKCDMKGAVVLWYKDKNLISTGGVSISPLYHLNPNNFALTIINATTQQQGDYFCEIAPQKDQTHIKVIVANELFSKNSSVSQIVRTGSQNIVAFISSILLFLSMHKVFIPLL